MNKIVILLIFSIFFINIVNCETLIYDNLTSSNYKYIILDDDLNIKYINEYKYDVLFNNSYHGTFKKGDKIFYPNNNTDIIIVIPDSINTDYTTAYDTAKPYLIIVLSFMISIGFIIVLLYWIIRKFITKR